MRFDVHRVSLYCEYAVCFMHRQSNEAHTYLALGLLETTA